MLETFVVSSLLGREVISKSIGEATKKTYDNISLLLQNDEFIFKNVLEELDIKVKINIINKLIAEFDKKFLSDVVHQCLVNLHEIVEKINLEIESIKNESTKYNNLWFKYLYTNPTINLINNLKKHTFIMDQRLEMLVKVLNIRHN